MHFVLRANDNSTHRNSDGKSYLDYYLIFIIYQRAKCTFKVTPGYLFRGRVYQPTVTRVTSDYLSLVSRMTSHVKAPYLYASIQFKIKLINTNLGNSDCL